MQDSRPRWKRKSNKSGKSCKDHPDHFKTLAGPMTGLRRVHVADSFVLLFEVDKKRQALKLVLLAHHDEAYQHPKPRRDQKYNFL